MSSAKRRSIVCRQSLSNERRKLGRTYSFRKKEGDARMAGLYSIVLFVLAALEIISSSSMIIIVIMIIWPFAGS